MPPIRPTYIFTISKGGNILREKLPFILHDILKFDVDICGMTRIHCTSGLAEESKYIPVYDKLSVYLYF